MITDQVIYREYPETDPGVVNIALVGGDSGCKHLIIFLEAHTFRHIRLEIGVLCGG